MICWRSHIMFVRTENVSRVIKVWTLFSFSEFRVVPKETGTTVEFGLCWICPVLPCTDYSHAQGEMLVHKVLFSHYYSCYWYVCNLLNFTQSIHLGKWKEDACSLTVDNLYRCISAETGHTSSCACRRKTLLGIISNCWEPTRDAMFTALRSAPNSHRWHSIDNIKPKPTFRPVSINYSRKYLMLWCI